MVRYELQGEKIVIDGEELTVIYFAGSPEEPWFKAKVVHNFLGSANINHTMARVHEDDKGHLKDLVASKGAPMVGSGVTSAVTPPNYTDYNEGKAWLVRQRERTLSTASSWAPKRPWRRHSSAGW
jgi:hypothetical protein